MGRPGALNGEQGRARERGSRALSPAELQPALEHSRCGASTTPSSGPPSPACGMPVPGPGRTRCSSGGKTDRQENRPVRRARLMLPAGHVTRANHGAQAPRAEIVFSQGRGREAHRGSVLIFLSLNTVCCAKCRGGLRPAAGSRWFRGSPSGWFRFPTPTASRFSGRDRRRPHAQAWPRGNRTASALARRRRSRRARWRFPVRGRCRATGTGRAGPALRH